MNVKAVSAVQDALYRMAEGDIESPIDEEVSGILTTKYDEARQLLVDNRHLLDRVAEALLERETLERPQLEILLRGEPLPEPQSESSDREAAPQPTQGKRDDEEGLAGGKIPDPEPMPS